MDNEFMTLAEKAAYIKGLIDGLKIDSSKDENKILIALSNLVIDMADEIDNIDEEIDYVYDEIDNIDEEIDYVYDDIENLTEVVEDCISDRYDNCAGCMYNDDEYDYEDEDDDFFEDDENEDDE